MEDALPPGFARFIDPAADRFAILLALLAERGLRPSVAEIAGSRHLVVAPERVPFNSKPTRVLAAHYDRAPGSPGANDNSAAVFQLAAVAERLRADGDDGWLVVFTDREEAASEEGVRGQGSYALAEGFKAIGLGEAEFFIFDACGRGDTIVVSTTVDFLARDAEATRKGARELRLRALEAGRAAAASIILAPTPFSDDAGFLAAGVAAQTIALLPAQEAASLSRALRGRPERALALVNRKARDLVEPRAYRAFMPATWRALHGGSDSAAGLTPAAFPLMERYARALARR